MPFPAMVRAKSAIGGIIKDVDAFGSLSSFMTSTKMLPGIWPFSQFSLPLTKPTPEIEPPPAAMAGVQGDLYHAAQSLSPPG